MLYLNKVPGMVWVQCLDLKHKFCPDGCRACFEANLPGKRFDGVL